LSNYEELERSKDNGQGYSENEELSITFEGKSDAANISAVTEKLKSGLRRKKPSPVWDDFDVETKNGRTVTTCRRCRKAVSAQARRLRKHLDTCKGVFAGEGEQNSSQDAQSSQASSRSESGLNFRDYSTHDNFLLAKRQANQRQGRLTGAVTLLSKGKKQELDVKLGKLNSHLIFHFICWKTQDFKIS
jgi:hypothetical protein